jgi:hypothetical protein
MVDSSLEDFQQADPHYTIQFLISCSSQRQVADIGFDVLGLDDFVVWDKRLGFI